MIKGLGLDESMSNLTSTISGETSISSNARNDQSSSTTTTTANNNTMSFASPHQVPGQPPPAKKKRGLPGNPDPDAEVIALSPKSLLATNRFICEICNKGFQRDQNLQLHRRGHNLPWKLKQRAKDQVIRKKVYVCPEPSCVHHDPSRALGDLTGIKKHFCRKHGEKKWKCEKCSKKYAVQSDWKAHSKICGTREYRCDCGTLFSRRDSFITHRAFCDALAEESARAINPLSTLPSSVAHQQTAAGVIAGITSSSLSHINLPPHLSSHHQLLQSLPLKREPDHHHHHHNHQNLVGARSEIPPWLACPQQQQQQQQTMYPFQQSQYEQQSCSNDNNNNNGMGSTLSPFQAPVHPQMSATALLQKAAEMGVTVSNQHQQQQQQQLPQQQQQQQQVLLSNNSSTCGLTGFGQEHHQAISEAQSSMLHDVMMMSSFQSSGPPVSGGFDSSSGFGDFHHQAMAATKGGGGGGGGGNDGLTRDFLGLRTFSHKDFLSMAGLGHMNHSSTPFEQQPQQQQQHDQHNHNQTPW
ncbi:Protein indeterminate-domain 7 [Bienertia sinuspersici]